MMLENNPIKVLQLYHDYNIMIRCKYMSSIYFYFSYCMIVGMISIGYKKYISDNKFFFFGILINSLFIPIFLEKIIMKCFYIYHIEPEFIKIVKDHNLIYDPRILKFKYNELNQIMKEEHIFNEKENKKICTICESNYSSIKLNCSGKGFHGGCEKCIGTWLKKNNSCPLCREKIINFDKLLK